jgi:uncharacterized protein DUF4328
MSQPWHKPVRGALKPIRGLGIAASVLIGLAVLTSIASTWSDWFSSGVVADYLDDVAGVTEADLATADSVAALTGLSDSAAVLAAGVVFIVWLSFARRNSEILYGKAGHRRTTAWVGWAWFIPVVSLWFPYQVVQDVYRPSTRLSGTVVRWWWAAFATKLFLGGVFTRLYLGDDFSADKFQTVAVISTLIAVLGVVAAVLVIRIIREITEGQLVPVEVHIPIHHAPESL